MHLCFKETTTSHHKDEKDYGEDFGPQAMENDCQRLWQSFSKRKREDPEGSHTGEADKHVEKRHRKSPGPSAPLAESGRPLKLHRAPKTELMENACSFTLQDHWQLTAALQRAAEAEEDAAAAVKELGQARDGLRAALGSQQAALKSQEEVHTKLCSIRAGRDAVAVQVLRAGKDAKSAAAVLRRQASARSPNDLRQVAREREAAAAVHLAECQMEQDLAEAKERIRHLAAQLEEEQQWRTEAERILWDYGLEGPQFERHSVALSLLTQHRHDGPPPAPSTPPLFENKAAVHWLPVPRQQLLSRL
ncbi:hypothetical protein COCOBI_12-5210 [Coccomyxa sp. Obi]|nr:hypothetical protein COCOBI_12-5210 [Coccomyxa sp. Obi]